MSRSLLIAVGIVCLPAGPFRGGNLMAQVVRGGHSLGVRCLAYAPDGKTVATGHLDNVIRLWDASTGAEVGRLGWYWRQINMIAFIADGKVLVSCGNEAGVRIWDVAARTGSRALQVHDRQVRCLAFSADGRTLATGGGFHDATARVWEFPGLKEIAAFKIADEVVGIDHLALSPDGKSLATPGDEFGSVYLWDVATGRHRIVVPGHDIKTSSLAFSPDNRTLAIQDGGEHGAFIRLYDIGASRERAFRIGEGGALAFSPDGKVLAIGGGVTDSVHSSGRLTLWEVATGRKLAERVIPNQDKQEHAVPNHLISCLAFSPDGRRLVTGSLAGSEILRFWDVEDLYKAQ